MKRKNERIYIFLMEFNLDFQCPLDQDAFSQLYGFETLTNLLNLGLNIQNNNTHTLPNK